MVSKKDIKGLEFNNIEEYFEYIQDSRINGNRQQAKNLYKKLSEAQKLEFVNWYDIYNYYDRPDHEETESESITDMLNYLTK